MNTSALVLLDVGNTHTHLGVANPEGIRRTRDIPTASWFDGTAAARLRAFVGRQKIRSAALCSVVPKATTPAVAAVERAFGSRPLVLGPRTVRGVGIDYPKPATIGPDRLANAIAVRHHFGAPSVVVDFGTAVTFDVVDRNGRYVGGIITPGLAAMTDYLADKTALLPRIRIRETSAVIGRSTREAMLIGAVHGYRGLIRELIHELKRELGARRLPVVATGGYASLLASKLPEITTVFPNLTLEGLRLALALSEEQCR